MPERRPYIAGNWKMYKTMAEARAFHNGFAARNRTSSSSREVRSPQRRHTTRYRLPWSSTTRRAPPAWCSPSTFCVTIPASSPRRSSSATARWPAFGAAAAMCCHP